MLGRESLHQRFPETQWHTVVSRFPATLQTGTDATYLAQTNRGAWAHGDTTTNKLDDFTMLQ